MDPNSDTFDVVSEPRLDSSTVVEIVLVWIDFNVSGIRSDTRDIEFGTDF